MRKAILLAWAALLCFTSCVDRTAEDAAIPERVSQEESGPGEWREQQWLEHEVSKLHGDRIVSINMWLQYGEEQERVLISYRVTEEEIARPEAEEQEVHTQIFAVDGDGALTLLKELNCGLLRAGKIVGEQSDPMLYLFAEEYRDLLLDYEGEVRTEKEEYNYVDFPRVEGGLIAAKIFTGVDADTGRSTYETVYINERGETVLGPFSGSGYAFSAAGYATMRFNGDQRFSYIDMEGTAYLRDTVPWVDGQTSAPFRCEATRPDFVLAYERENHPWDGRLLTFEGKVASLAEDCTGDILENEIQYLGSNVIRHGWDQRFEVELKENREAVIAGDPELYLWAAFDYQYDPMLVLEDSAGTQVIYQISVQDGKF